MHLVVDIGNTNIVFGVYDHSWVKVFRHSTDNISKSLITQLLEHELKGVAGISQVTLSSVVPQVTTKITEVLEVLVSDRPLIIGPELYDGLNIEILNPTEIGTDLVANAVAALNRVEGDCIITDFGTALTFSVVRNRKIIGVNILPGIKTALNALVGNAAQLSHIPLELTDSVIGKDTPTAIQSGILWGYVGLVERMLERIELEVSTPLNKVATGGLSLILSPLRDHFDVVDQNLTLDGIRLIGETFN